MRKLLNLKILVFVSVLVLAMVGLGYMLCHIRNNTIQQSNQEKLHAIWLGLRNYETTYESLPPTHAVNSNGVSILSWRALIHQFLESTGLPFEPSASWDSPDNKQLRDSGMASRFALYSVPETCWRRIELLPFAMEGSGTAFSSDQTIDNLPPYVVLLVAAPREDTHWMAPVDLPVELFSTPGVNLKEALNVPNLEFLYVLYANGKVFSLPTETQVSELRPYLTAEAAKQQLSPIGLDLTK